jgi:glucose/arabinose dehydrogenase
MPTRPPRRAFLILLVLTLLFAIYWWWTGGRPQLAVINLPGGFQISYYADSVIGARSLALGERGTVFVGSREAGKVYALVDRDEDARADSVLVIAQGLHSPNGVTFRDGALYVAEVSRIIRFDSIESRLDHPPRPVTVLDGLPTEEHHGWKFIRFGPDGRLYVPVGAPCNTCLPEDSLYAAIFSVTPDGGDLRMEASGVRNTVGFDWHPGTGEFWFTDNGRDWLGENEPPDELNRRTARNQHFGFPFCSGKALTDPEFGGERRCDELTPPAVELGPHVAALGMRFYTGSMFPPEYRNQIFIAEHGSWNRILGSGYRVTVVKEKDDKFEYEVFADGWLHLNRAWGRPVDVMQMPDGALLVSDDRADAVYRISYHAK